MARWHHVSTASCAQLSLALQAMAAHNSGGKVIVQVERIVDRGTIPARDAHIPGALVDAVTALCPRSAAVLHAARMCCRASVVCESAAVAAFGAGWGSVHISVDHCLMLAPAGCMLPAIVMFRTCCYCCTADRCGHARQPLAVAGLARISGLAFRCPLLKQAAGLQSA